MPSFSNEPSDKLRYETDGGLRRKLKDEIKIELQKELQAELGRIVKDEIKREFGVELHGDKNGGLTDQFNGIKSSDRSNKDVPPSIFTPMCHPLVEDAIRDVDEYYLRNWGFPNEKTKLKFVSAGFSRVTCLYFPKSLNERIRYACSLLTILFLIDGKYSDSRLL